jgi:hypothetical protein
MPKAKPVSTHGLGFEDAMKVLIATPPMPTGKKAKRAAARKPKFGRN